MLGKIMRQWFLIGIIFITAIVSAHAADSTAIHFASLDKKDGVPVELTAWWFKAAGPGKRATIIAMHGCGGLYSTKKGHQSEFNARHKNMVQLLQSSGYNVLFVDSFTARGVRSICTSKYGARDITTDNRRLDVQGALLWVAAQPEVNPARIALLGWSNGGSTVLNSIDKQFQNDTVPHPKAAVAFYPGCARYAKRKNYAIDMPLLILIGEKDDWTPAEACVEFGKKLKPASVKVNVYADSYHDFDAPDLPIKVRKDVPNGVHPGAGVTTGSNPAAKEAAYKEMLEFLQQKLR
jgi:dienelactone hydrolase